MSAIRTIGLFEKDSRIFYVGEGVIVLEDPFEGDIKVYFKKEQENKVARAIKMAGMQATDKVVQRGEYMTQKLRRVSDDES